MSQPDSSTAARRYNQRLGLSLFALYLALYAGFVLLSAFGPAWMERIVVAGLNLAVVYGFGLIGFAVVLAAIYGLLCRDDAGPGAPR